MWSVGELRPNRKQLISNSQWRSIDDRQTDSWQHKVGDPELTFSQLWGEEMQVNDAINWHMTGWQVH